MDWWRLVDDFRGPETQRAEAPVDGIVGAERSQQRMHQLLALLGAAARELRNEDPAAQGTLLDAISILRKRSDRQPARGDPVERGRLMAWQVRKVRTYVDSHIAERTRVADLSALIGLSEAHFSRAFKRTFGKSPHAFLIRRRVELATQYLLQTSASMSDIAVRCGFADQAHLCRAFRQATGVSPALWRRKQRTHDEDTGLAPASDENHAEMPRVA